MRTHKTRILISFILILSLLLSPFGGFSLTANATEGEPNKTDTKTITGITVSLKKDIKNIFYVADSEDASDNTLDLDDINVTINFSDESEPEIITLPSSKYNITTNISEIRKKEGKDQKITATLTNTDKTTITSSNDLLVTILPAKIVTPKKISLKLKDEKNTTFYAANDLLGKEDTLDEDDLSLDITYEIKTPKDNYYDIADESNRYDVELQEKPKTIELPTNIYKVTTNISEVRSKIEKDQELWAELEYLSSVEGNKKIYTTISSKDNTPADNPKVTIIEPEETITLKSIQLKLKDNKTSFYVDNGVLGKNDTLDADDLVLVGTFEKIINKKASGKTEEKELSFNSSNYKITTNIDNIRGLIALDKNDKPTSQEITATLTYKDSNGKDTSLKASAKVTILPPYAVNGTVTITPQNFGANPTDIKTDKAAIQDALDLASADHKLLVKVPAGTYYTGGNIFIHSNTTLSLDDGATIVRNSNSDTGVAAGTSNRLGVNKNLLKISPYNSTTTTTAGGYTNGENIVIEGGTFDGGNISVATGAANLLNLGHAKNITIRNSTFKNCYGNHLIELVAVQNAEISGCSFSGFRYVTSELKDEDGNVSFEDSTGNYAEAIQIDVAHKEGSSAWTSAYKTDDTACANINIHDNTFSDYPVAIGNHHSLEGHHHTNVNVSYNKITAANSMNTGINLCGCDNSSATGNTITNFDAGIRVRASQAFTVSNNNINSAGYGIIETEASSGQITNNTIDKLEKQGIIVYGSGTSATVVSLNTISNSKKCGILIHVNASCETVSSNKINACTESGIKVYDSANVNSLKTNTISNCQTSGIEIYSSAKVASVAENTISNISSCGINVYSSASVPSITKNKITQAGASGIEVNSNAVATNIKNNTIDKCSKYGIYVAGKASVKTLSSNTIKNIAKNGIYVKDDKIKLTFKSNKLTRVGKTAIKIDSKLSAKKTQKYTFAPKVISLNLKGGVMTTQASNLKKIKLKVGSKSYTKSTKKKKYTFKFKKYKKKASSATVTFTDKNKNTVARVLDFN